MNISKKNNINNIEVNKSVKASRITVMVQK